MPGNTVKLVVYVPLSHADVVRDALATAGAGRIGNYTHCSFTVVGEGRFKGNEHSNPALGVKERIETVQECRIEVTVKKPLLHRVISAMKAVHPYEEVAFDIYPLLDHTEILP